VLIKTTAAFIKNKLLPLKEVIFIDVRTEPHAEISIIGYDRQLRCAQRGRLFHTLVQMEKM
jgi:hypothetical protein